MARCCNGQLLLVTRCAIFNDLLIPGDYIPLELEFSYPRSIAQVNRYTNPSDYSFSSLIGVCPHTVVALGTVRGQNLKIATITRESVSNNMNDTKPNFRFLRRTCKCPSPSAANHSCPINVSIGQPIRPTLSREHLPLSYRLTFPVPRHLVGVPTDFPLRKPPPSPTLAPAVAPVAGVPSADDNGGTRRKRPRQL